MRPEARGKFKAPADTDPVLDSEYIVTFTAATAPAIVDEVARWVKLCRCAVCMYAASGGCSDQHAAPAVSTSASFAFFELSNMVLLAIHGIIPAACSHILDQVQLLCTSQLACAGAGHDAGAAPHAPTASVVCRDRQVQVANPGVTFRLLGNQEVGWKGLAYKVSSAVAVEGGGNTHQPLTGSQRSCHARQVST